jgi:hypothetical protein
MKKNKVSKTYLKVFFNLFIIFLLLIMLFTRSFAGLQYKGLLIGQGVVLFSLLMCFVVIFGFEKLNISQYIDKKTRNIYLFIVISFFVNSILSDSNFTDPYTFKTSSYIWTISLLFLSVYLFTYVDFNPQYCWIFIPVPFLMYLFSTGYYPDFIINLFKEYSDKFQFLKASDIMIATISANLFIYNLLQKKIYRFLYLVVTVSLILPLLLYMSRGSFVALFIYLIYETYYSKDFILNNKIKTLLIFAFGVLIFLGSLIFVDYLYVNEETKSLKYNEIILNPSTVITGSVSELALKNETRTVFLSFYIHYGRLESRDPTTNWRLDIWQDILFDLVEEDRVLTGYGYKEILPQMTDPTAPGRLGRDGLNENVHSYFVNIIARGGILQLIGIFYFFYSIINKYYVENKNSKIISFILPVLFCSSLDISMEGVQFPLVFYIVLGYFITNQKIELEHINSQEL